MAQNITLMGASYSDVPAVQLPKTGGGTATFTDVTPTTALAADVASGKYFFDALGVLTQGTASGGGGGGWQTLHDGNVWINTSSPNWGAVDSYTTPLAANQTYRVTWVNDEYVCDTVAIQNASIYDGYYIGNPAVVGGSQSAGNEPFFIYRDTSTRLLICTSTAGEQNVYFKLELQVSSQSGLVYETGTFTPSTDETAHDVTFSNQHATAPMLYMCWDISSGRTSNNSPVNIMFGSAYNADGTTIYSGSSGTATFYGRFQCNYLGTNSISASGRNTQTINGSSYNALNWHVTSSGMHIYTDSSTCYFRTTRTYRWIAIWPPSTW